MFLLLGLAGKMTLISWITHKNTLFISFDEHHSLDMTNFGTGWTNKNG